MILVALCTSALAFAPPRRGPHWTPLAYGRRGDADHDRWRSTADALTAWRGDEATVAKFWRIDCDDAGFTWERRWPGRKSQIEDVPWDRITRVCWECGEWLMMDNFYLMDDHEDRVGRAVGGAQLSAPRRRARPQGHVPHQDVRRMPVRRDGGVTICEANANARAPSADLSYVDAQKGRLQEACPG